MITNNIYYSIDIPIIIMIINIVTLFVSRLQLINI